jgi:RNA-directed DNA polymerase
MDAPACGAKPSIQRRYRAASASEQRGRERETSEDFIVPRKQGKRPYATLWREGGPKPTDPVEGKMPGTPSPTTVSTKLHRIATLAREAPQRALTTLAHHIDVAFLREAFRRTRKDGAPGIDGQTAAAYAEDLERHLRSLLDRFKSGTYVAPPVRRVYIPKDERGATRPIGIPAFEDKVLQRAVAMVLEAVYEQDFLACSYGFRPRRSAHQMLQALWEQAMKRRGGGLLKVDVQSYFDTINHYHLRGILDQRVRDGVIRRTIDKWLNAGALEHGSVTRPETGVPQGSGVAPLLANVFLHTILDAWFEQVAMPRLDGEATLYRFADDLVILCARERDAQRLMTVLPKRLAKYGLTLHPTKTRVIRFTRPPYTPQGQRAQASSRSGTFDLLGFTHYWGRSRQGNWVVKRKTTVKRLSRALHRFNAWCRHHRHAPVAWQHQQLVQKLRGHYAYYGITGNEHRLRRVRWEVIRLWRKWLNRRSQRRRMRWERFVRLLEHYPLPRVRIVHTTVGT